MKNVLFLMVLFIDFSVCCQTVEKEGLLWKITGQDIKQPSYLFGTYHGTNGVGADFLDSISGFYDAFNAVTQYVGEIDDSTSSEVVNEYFTKYYGIQFMPADTVYKDLLSENDYQYLDSIAQVLWGRTSLTRIPLRPNYLWSMISQSKRSEVMQQISGTSKKEVMDVYLLKIAREKGYTVKGLDSPEILFKLLELEYGKTPLPQSLQESADTLINNVKIIEETYKQLFNSDLVRNIIDFENAYKRQDLLSLEKYKKEQIDRFKENSGLSEFDISISISSLSDINIDQMMSSFLKERNLFWVEKIPELISSQATMIGVGTAHLCGKEGLINLLRQKGYCLEVVK